MVHEDGVELCYVVSGYIFLDPEPHSNESIKKRNKKEAMVPKDWVIRPHMSKACYIAARDPTTEIIIITSKKGRKFINKKLTSKWGELARVKSHLFRSYNVNLYLSILTRTLCWILPKQQKSILIITTVWYIQRGMKLFIPTFCSKEALRFWVEIPKWPSLALNRYLETKRYWEARHIGNSKLSVLLKRWNFWESKNLRLKNHWLYWPFLESKGQYKNM